MTAVFWFSAVNSIELSNMFTKFSSFVPWKPILRDFKTYLTMERSLHKINCTCVSTCMKNYRSVKLCNVKGEETKKRTANDSTNVTNWCHVDLSTPF